MCFLHINSILVVNFWSYFCCLIDSNRHFIFRLNWFFEFHLGVRRSQLQLLRCNHRCAWEMGRDAIASSQYFLMWKKWFYFLVFWFRSSKILITWKYCLYLHECSKLMNKVNAVYKKSKIKTSKLLWVLNVCSILLNLY